MQTYGIVKYKLFNQDDTTYAGFQWVEGEKKTITKKGSTLCSDEVFHAYHSPPQAVIFNPIHANYRNPKCRRVLVWNIVADDHTKIGCKTLLPLEEVLLPKYSLSQLVAFAILCARHVCQDKKWNAWAASWLDKTNRSEGPEWAAVWAARAVSSSRASWIAGAERGEAALAAKWAVEWAVVKIDLDALIEEAAKYE